MKDQDAKEKACGLLVLTHQNRESPVQVCAQGMST